MRKSKRLKRVCKSCGSEFLIYPSQLKRGDTFGSFCSKECFFEAKKPHMKGQYFCLHPLKEICTIPTEVWKIAYLAGIVDGEGSIVFKKAAHNYQGVNAEILVCNTNMQLLEWIQKEFGGHAFIKRTPSQYECRLALANTILKPAFQWRVSTVKDCLKLSKAMLPYLIVKKANAEKMIEYCSGCIKNHEEKIDKFKKGELKTTYNIKNRKEGEK